MDSKHIITLRYMGLDIEVRGVYTPEIKQTDVRFNPDCSEFEISSVWIENTKINLEEFLTELYIIGGNPWKDLERMCIEEIER